MVDENRVWPVGRGGLSASFGSDLICSQCSTLHFLCLLLLGLEWIFKAVWL